MELNLFKRSNKYVRALYKKTDTENNIDIDIDMNSKRLFDLGIPTRLITPNHLKCLIKNYFNFSRYNKSPVLNSIRLLDTEKIELDYNL